MYEIALWLHITGAALLFLALGAEIFSGVRLRRAGDVVELRSVARLAGMTGPVHGVASLLLLGFGIYLAMEQFSLTDGWILASLVITLSFSVVGPAVVAKRHRHLAERIESTPPGTADAELVAALNDPFLWTLMHGMAGSAFGIIFLMTNKPSAVVSWLVVVGTFVVGAAGGRMAAGRGAARGEALAAG